MAVLPLHKYFIYDNELRPNSLFVPSENEGGIYEVFRVINGVPLFFEDHINRFYHSAELANKKVKYNIGQIEKLLVELIQKNKVSEGNVLISCKTIFKAFFIQHNYPTKKMYREGVTCGILEAERKNPNAKLFQTTVRNAADKLIQQNGFYEIILVDQHGRITEGSRTNIFFVLNDGLVTPPGNNVLLGITRQKIIDLAKELNIGFKEQDIWLKNVNQFSAAVITGTSPKILPLRQMGKVKFDPENKIILDLMDGFEIMIREYLNKK